MIDCIMLLISSNRTKISGPSSVVMFLAKIILAMPAMNTSSEHTKMVVISPYNHVEQLPQLIYDMYSS